MAASNDKLLCLLKILEKTDKENPVNASEIAKKIFEELGEPTTRQMVYQLIRLLKSYDYAIVNSRKHNGGWYMKHEKFDDAQLKIMIDAVCQSNYLPPQESREIASKLCKNISKESKKKLKALYQPNPKDTAEDHAILKNLDTIMEAAYHRKQIKFHYTYLDGNMKRQIRYDEKLHTPKEYAMNVYTLQWAGEIYYVIGGQDTHCPELSTYRLDRMCDVSISDKELVKMEDFLGTDNVTYAKNKLEDFLDKSVDHYSGESLTLLLEFEPKPIQMAILKDFVGSSALHIRKMENGKVRAKVNKYDSPTLIGWLMEYANYFEVIEPQKTREKLGQRALQLAEKYKD